MQFLVFCGVALSYAEAAESWLWLTPVKPVYFYTNVVYSGANIDSRTLMMRAARTHPTKKGTHRLSVSLSAEQYAELLEIAQKNKVSIAWVVREAIERLLKDELPLFHVRQPK